MERSVTLEKQTSCTADFISPKEYNDAIGIVKARVHYYRNAGWLQFSTDDLCSAGYNGIVEASIRFNPSKGTVRETKFTSYAYFWINKCIQEYIARNKSMLSGTLADCYRGSVDDTISIDQYTDAENSGGQDHLGFIAVTDDDVVETMTKPYLQQKTKALVDTMLMELPDQLRLVWSLAHGLGTVNGDGLDIRGIAKALECTKQYAENLLNEARTAMASISAKYQAEYQEILLER